MQPADIDRVEAVHVLGRVDRLDHRAGADLLGQRQLHQDAVHRRVGIEPRDHRQQFGLGVVSAGRRMVWAAMPAAPAARSLLRT